MVFKYYIAFLLASAVTCFEIHSQNSYSSESDSRFKRNIFSNNQNGAKLKPALNPKHLFTNLRPLQSHNEFREQKQLLSQLQIFQADPNSAENFPFALSRDMFSQMKNLSRTSAITKPFSGVESQQVLNSVPPKEMMHHSTTKTSLKFPAPERNSRIMTSIKLSGIDDQQFSFFHSKFFNGSLQSEGENDLLQQQSRIQQHNQQKQAYETLNRPITKKDFPDHSSSLLTPFLNVNSQPAVSKPQLLSNINHSKIKDNGKVISQPLTKNDNLIFPTRDLNHHLKSSIRNLLKQPQLPLEQRNLESDSHTPTSTPISSQIIPPNRDFNFPQAIKNEVSTNVPDPEFYLSDNSPERYQPPVGGPCVTSFNDRGMCVPLNECPTMRSVANQQQYTHIVQHLASNMCRYSGDQVYFCCPFYTFSGSLPSASRSRSNFIGNSPTSPFTATFPQPTECGKVKVAQSRIIGGSSIQAGSFPWLAAVGTPQGEKNFVITCSGSIITKRHILSAAHCFYDPEDENPTHVRLAEHNIYSNEGPEHQDYLIVARHDPKYFWTSKQNDLIVLTLDKEIIYNDYIQPVCLPFTRLEEPLDGRPMVATGYGLTREGSDKTPAIAHTVQLLTRPRSRCQQGYTGQRGSPIALVDHRSICAGGENGFGICNGDSGGPIHITDPQSGQFIQVGVMIASNGCGLADFPSISTRLAPYLPWLRSIVSQ